METSPLKNPRHRRTTPLFRYTLVALVSATASTLALWSYLDDSLGRTPQGELVYKHPAKTAVPVVRGINDGISFTQDIRKFDTEAEFRKLISNPSATKGSVIFADINNDKVEDALVGIYGEGSAGFLNQAVYTVIAGRLKLLWRNPDTLARAKGYLGVDQTVVLVGSKDFEPGMTANDTTYTYRWSGSTFERSQ